MPEDSSTVSRTLWSLQLKCQKIAQQFHARCGLSKQDDDVVHFHLLIEQTVTLQKKITCLAPF